MQLNDLPKNIQRLLLSHWTLEELNDRLKEPDYFFDHVVTPRLDFLRRSDEDTPRIRFQKNQNGQPQVLLFSSNP